MKEDELKEIFFAEALDGYEELNRYLIILEKDTTNTKAIDAIFRITHTLKANAAGMGYMDVAAMAHTFEDVFTEIKNGKLVIENEFFNDLFRANDVFGQLLNQIKTDEKIPIKFKGIKTKLEVAVRKAKFGAESIPEQFVSKKLVNETDSKLPNEITIKLDPTYNHTHSEDTSKAGTDTVVNDDKLSEADTTTNEVKVAFSDLVSIPIRKLDNLMNLVGELIIERDRVITALNQISNTNEFSRLQRITSELQYSVMDVRLVQINILFNKFHRIVRDTAAIENKKINLQLEGTENEIDRNILQIISDSLVHIVRNAISHGIESKSERLKASKTEIGNVTIRAKSEKDAVIIEVEDDGKGIDAKIIRKKAAEKGLLPLDILNNMTDQAVIQLIFEPGFSSAEQITAVSGRGVGMDVVKRALDSIGGKVNIATDVGKGSKISLISPSSMALKSALLFGLGTNEFAIPLSYIDAVIQLNKSEIHKVSKGLVATHLDKTISIVFLRNFLNSSTIEEMSEGNLWQMGYNNLELAEKHYVVIVSYGNRNVGFVVDRLMQQKEIVEKPLSKPLDNAKFISGATILGNGNVCLVLDIPDIVGQIFKLSKF